MAENSKQIRGGITLLGLGSGDPGLMTREAWDWLMSIDTLYLQTQNCPEAAHLPAHLTLICLEDVIPQNEDLGKVPQLIGEAILTLGRKEAEGVTYARRWTSIHCECSLPRDRQAGRG